MTAPDGVDPTITTIEKDGVILFPRGTDQLPPETQEIQPHPKGIELGILIQMMKDFEASNKRGGTLYNFLQEEFCRVSPGKASEFCKAAGVHSRTKVSDLEPQAGREAVQGIPGSQAPRRRRRIASRRSACGRCSRACSRA